MQEFNRGLTLIICIMIITLMVFAGSSDIMAQEVVTAEGRAAISNGEALARDEALQDAYRRAVEKAAGVHIRSTTLMENLQVVEQEIIAKSEGLVESYDIIRERRDGSIYIVEIRATVSRELRSELENLGFILQEQLGNPRVMLLVKEENVGQETFFSLFGSELRSILAEAGFNLVNPDVAQEIRGREETRQMLDGNYQAAVAIGQDYDADIVIHGRTFTSFMAERDVGSGTFYTMEAYADVQATTTQDARIIASISESSSQYAPSKEVAGNEALKSIADEVKVDLVRNVIAGINQAGGGRSITVVAVNVPDFAAAMELEETLRNTRGVERVDFRSFDNQVAQYELNISLSPQNLAVHISQQPRLSITQLQSHRMEISFD